MCIPGKGDRLWESDAFVKIPDEDATVCFCTLNPEPQTLNPEPQTLNPEP
jgi:hypothetical protein